MKIYSLYVPVEGAELYTVVALPAEEGRFPVVIYRSPYVDDMETMEDEAIWEITVRNNQNWLDAGYAVVSQHCRGRGRSTGDCIPYIYEREDGLALHEWIRRQSFYNGELYLCGGSYTSSVHFVTAPWAEDIKGAVLEIQDCERYNCNYRNGFYKIGLHGGWYVGMYKHKSIRHKNYTDAAYNMLPMSEFSETVFSEKAADFDAILDHPERDDAFWMTRYGGGEAHNAVKSTQVPVLLVTGFYDIYTGGIFDMWKTMDPETRQKCALVVSPYDHGGTANGQPIAFENGCIADAYGDFRVRWLNAVRGLEEMPFVPGKVTYFKLFGDMWCEDEQVAGNEVIELPIGSGEHTYVYNPYDPAPFKGGLSTNFGGAAWQDPPNSRYDILTFYTDEFTEDVFVKGQMSARLCVKSDCEDTCFYMRISLVKAEGDYGLRDDINSIAHYAEDYVPGTEVMMDFIFDEHAFVIHKGEKLRIDVSSSAFPWYVRHTNVKGPWAQIRKAKIAHNTVLLDQSILNIPIG